MFSSFVVSVSNRCLYCSCTSCPQRNRRGALLGTTFQHLCCCLVRILDIEIRNLLFFFSCIFSWRWLCLSLIMRADISFGLQSFSVLTYDRSIDFHHIWAIGQLLYTCTRFPGFVVTPSNPMSPLVIPCNPLYPFVVPCHPRYRPVTPCHPLFTACNPL